MSFAECYQQARQNYSACNYQQAADLFQQAKRIAVSDFAKGDCDWWLGLCRAWIRNR